MLRMLGYIPGYISRGGHGVSENYCLEYNFGIKININVLIFFSFQMAHCCFHRLDSQ
jgi:hypothetical protein